VKKSLHVFIIVSTIIVLDQITKYLVSTSIGPFDTFEIFPFLHIKHVWNTGSAFGMFKNLGGNFFILLSIVAIVIILYFLKKSTYSRFGLSLVLGGAIGNLIDRIRFGKVFDFIFINVEVGGHYWPVFNVADSSLTIGVSVIFLLAFIKKE